MTQYEVVPVAAPGWSYLHKLVRGVGRQHYSPVITTLPTAGEIIGPGGQITQPGRDFGQIGAARRWNATPDNASPISYTIFQKLMKQMTHFPHHPISCSSIICYSKPF